MMGHRLAAGVFLTATLILSGQANATVTSRLNYDQLISRSTVTITGTVVDQRVVPFGDEIWTDTYVRVGDSLKGGVARGRIIRVRQPGGELGGRGMRVAGAASFLRNERVLLYLRPVGGGLFPIGLAQGKFSIYKDARGVERLRRDLRGLVFANPTSNGKTRLVHAAPGSDAKNIKLRLLIKRTQFVGKGGNR
jgi:hypothetical protein